MAGVSESLRVAAEAARVAAARVLSEPSLYSVLVVLRETQPGPRPTKLRFGFQEFRRHLFAGDTLTVSWVAVGLDPWSVATGSVGTFDREQFRGLTSLHGMSFPPPRLDLDRLRLEPVDALCVLKDQPLGGEAGLGVVDLSLCCYDGHLAWRVLQEVVGVGFGTLLLDAEDGHVLCEKIDPWCERGIPDGGGIQPGDG